MDRLGASLVQRRSGDQGHTPVVVRMDNTHCVVLFSLLSHSSFPPERSQAAPPAEDDASITSADIFDSPNKVG